MQANGRDSPETGGSEFCIALVGMALVGVLGGEERGGASGMYVRMSLVNGRDRRGGGLGDE